MEQRWLEKKVWSIYAILDWETSLLFVFNLAMDRTLRDACDWPKTDTIICKKSSTSLSESRNCQINVPCKNKVQLMNWNSTLFLLSMYIGQALGCKQQKLTLADKA